jgi:hypothetical protein
MKYLLFLIFIFSCSYELAWYNRPMPNYNVEIKELEKRINNINNELYKIDIISYYCLTEIKYKKVKGWLNPEEVAKLKYGDCTERAALFAWLCYQYLGIKAVIQRLKLSNGATHQTVYIEKYDYNFSHLVNSKIIEVLDFETYFRKVEYVH